MSWSAKDARDKFGSLFDTAVQEGPQIIRRNGVRFVLVTEQELEKRYAQKATHPEASFFSFWEALRLPPHDRLTEEEYKAFMRPIKELRRAGLRRVQL